MNVNIRTMRAAILQELKKPLVIDSVELPDRLEVGQVLVKVLFSGICGSQLGEIDGVKGEDRFLPHLLGHEGSGEVLETGPGVKFVKPGDRVVLHWRKGRGIDADPPILGWKGKRLNAGQVTTFNELAIVSENRLTTIPHDFDPAVAPLFGCAITTGFGIVTNDAKVKPGESVVVFGAGGVGLNVVQGAAMVSAHPIIAVDLFDNRLELARRFGADHVLNSGRVDVRQEISRILGGRGADVTVNNTPNTEVTALAFDLTKPQGRTILAGVPPKGRNVNLYTLPLHFGKVLAGSHGGSAEPHEDIPRYIGLLEAKKIRLDGLVTEIVHLDRVNEAIARLRDGTLAGRCLIRFS